MRKFFLPAAFAAVAASFAGCEPTPPPVSKLAIDQATTAPTTQPDEVVAELSTLKISRRDLDSLLYEAYGLRMLFDLVELDLAKDTAKAQNLVVTPQDIQNERQSILKGIAGPDAPESSYEDLLNQFLQNEHLSRVEFDVKIVQTDAYLRKIVSPIVIGKLPESALRRGFEQLYGAKRQIADIELNNSLDASIARKRLNENEPFDRVALSMSVDPDTKSNGGLWQPFSAQLPWVPQVIRDCAFSMEKGQISDILNADSKYHIIKLIDSIDPKIVKYEDVKNDVRKQLEQQLIKNNMTYLRQELIRKAQQELRFDDPTLQTQWDLLVQQQLGKNRDRESALKKLNEENAHPTTAPATQPRVP